MDKRERFSQFINGQPYTDGVPAAFFQHFSANSRMGQAAVKAQCNYFTETDMDIVKIMFDDIYPKLALVHTPDDWAKVGWANPKDHAFSTQLEVTKRVTDTLSGEAFVFQTLFSPFVSAGCAVSPILQWGDTVTEHFRKNPKAVSGALRNISESLLEYAYRMADTGIDGFYVSVQGGEEDRFEEDFFNEWLLPNDLQFLKGLKETGKKLIIHFCGTGLRAKPYFDYPGDVINMAFTENGLTLAQAQKGFMRPIMGGMGNHGVLCSGTKESIQREVGKILSSAPEGIMLGADCTVPANVPACNLRWAIEAAHQFRRPYWKV